MKIKIASINIEYGGALLYQKIKSKKEIIGKYVDLIKKNNIDIVCFQEAFYYNTSLDTTKSIATKLNYYHTNDEKSYLSIISKYPFEQIVNPSKFNILSCTLKINNQLIYISNIHLNDVPFTIYSLYGIPYPDTPMNITVNQAINLSYQTKKSDIDYLIKFYQKNNNPCVICGDFNEISHLDSNIKWKVSTKLTKIFTDVSRSLFPNIKKNPNYTWDINGQFPMRIDMIYCKNINHSKIKHLNLKLSDHLPMIATFEI
jgi:endonuclease/exonuclease/phosphatase family metal-dependent hydrolase